MTGAQRGGACTHEINCVLKLPDPTGGLDAATPSGEMAQLPDLIGRDCSTKTVAGLK